MTYWFNIIATNQGRRLYIGIFWALLTASSGVALLMLSGWFITATALTGIAISAGVVVMFDMYMPGSGIRFFTLSRTASRYIERVYNHESILLLISVFRLVLFKSLSALPLQQLRSTSDSEWLSRLTADLDALDNILLRYTIPPIVAALMVVVLSVFVSFIWLDLALYLGGFMLLCLLIIIPMTISRTKHYGAVTSSLLNQCRADIIEHLNGSFELQSYQLMQQHEATLTQRLEHFYTAQNALNSKLANIQLWLDLVFGTVLLVLIYITLSAVHSTLIDGPVAVMLVMMFLGASEVLQTMPTQFSSWGKTQFSANRLTGLMNATESQESVAVNKINSLADKVLTVKMITVKVTKNTKVATSLVKPLLLKITANQLVNIKGRSGSGKSTLANFMMGTEPTDSNNQVTINSDTHLSQVATSEWYKKAAYLEQGNSVLAGTLGYNLALGLDEVSATDIWAALKLVELATWANALPDGLNTWLGETGGKVSGGQARRICLARWLLRDPQLIILDEPFNGLDEQMAARIWTNIQPWLNNRMAVLLTHETPKYLAPDTISLDLNTVDND